MAFLELYFYDIPDIMDLNDFLRFEDDYIFSELEISETEEEEEEQDENGGYIIPLF